MTNQLRLEELNSKTYNKQIKQEVQELLLADPELWRTLGDPAIWIRDSALTDIESETVEDDCVKFGLDRMRAGLLADGSTDLEIITIDQILTHYIQVGNAGYKLVLTDLSKGKSDEGKYWEQRYNLAHSRLLKSMAMLTRLRKEKLMMAVIRNKNRRPESSRKSTPVSTFTPSQADSDSSN